MGLSLRTPFLLCLLGCLRVAAQDPQLSQFYAAPLYLNPALTGNTFQDRMILNYRKQWPGTGPGFNTYALSYDHNLSQVHSGVGAMLMRDVSGSNHLAFTQAAVNYSYEAHIDHDHALRFGMRLGYTMREYDASSVVFGDQVIRDNAPTSVERLPVDRISYFDASFGALYFTDNFWAGASFNHINQPQQSFYLSGDAKLPMRTSVHTGYRLALDGQRLARSKDRLTIAALYKAQQDWDQLDVGAYVDHDRLTAGLWYRGLPALKAYKPGYGNDDAVVAMIGFETDQQFRLVYSYDITVSNLSMRSLGSHEISLIYEWPHRSKNKKYKAVPCPKF